MLTSGFASSAKITLLTFLFKFNRLSFLVHPTFSFISQHFDMPLFLSPSGLTQQISNRQVQRQTLWCREQSNGDIVAVYLFSFVLKTF